MRSFALRSVAGSFALVMLAIVVGACASGHSTPVDASVIPKLAGAKWTGYVIGKIVIINPDISATGKLSVVNGQLILTNTGITGPAQDLAPANAVLDYSEKGGKQQLSGFGHNDAGPFSIAFSR
jgi:hypothetical protein